ncbi:MAG: oxygenase MpaB family protein [Akkermansiaceae bacterium]
MPDSLSADDFAFPPDSELWRVNRYANGLLFGPAAVLLQVAHPRVAQGVADHSDFREDALGRLRRTLSTVNRIAFGTTTEAEEMRARLKVVHGGVKGETPEGMAGSRKYSAFEPDLLMWVLATLIDASIKGYEFVWEPLSPERREDFYRDFRRFGTYFGLGEEVGPQGYGEFVKYYDEMLEGDLLGSHPLCAEVAAAVVRPQNPWRDRMLGKVVDFLPVETVPVAIRERLGLESSAWSRVRMTMLEKVAPVAFRTLPKWMTYYPESYDAEKTLGLGC